MTARAFLDGKVTLHCGDCLDVLDSTDENSVDSVVCDPPYHLTSIVKRFGAEGAAPAKGNPVYGRASAGFMGKQWDGGDVAFRIETWAAVLRVLKPGGYLIAFSGTRTYHRMAVAIEDAGFEVRDQIGWTYGSGFPKSKNLGNGFGTALKPAWEPIMLARKPIEGTNAQNVLRWGVGALNIDGCRVPTDEAWTETGEKVGTSTVNALGGHLNNSGRSSSHDLGRWPANVIHDGSDEVLAAFPEQQSGGTPATRAADKFRNTFGEFKGAPVENGIGSSEGNAARFFYTAKADAEDRLGSKHPTVKPLDLMQYLVRLVTPPGGLVLDPFAGTGTTGEAAWREGMRAVLIEREAEYQADIARRMELAASPTKRAAVAKSKNNLQGAEGTPLFGGEAA
jgi:site-specific DNA-methyltransferase (adenine-specific)